MLNQPGSDATSLQPEQVRSVLDASPGPLLLIDQASRVVTCNAAGVLLSVELHGRIPREGESADRYIPDGAPFAESPLIREALEGGIGSVEIEARTTGGEQRSYEVTCWPAVVDRGNVQVIGLTWHDITERSTAIRRSQRSEVALRQLLSRAPVIVFAFDPEGTVRFADGGGLELAGLDPDDLVGLNVFHDEARLVPRSNGSGGVVATLELERRLFDVVYSPVRQPDGTLTGYVAAALDASDRYTDDRRRFLDQKRESLARLAHGLAHDLGNVLTVFVGNASMLREQVEPGPAQELADEIVEASWRTNAIIRQLVSFADGRAVAGDLGPVDLNGIVEETIRLVRGFVPPDLTIYPLLEPDLPRVLGDASLLRELVSILTHNAVETSEGADGVRVVTTLEAPPAVDRRSMMVPPELPASPRISLAVHDDGPGMDRETLERIFDPYFSTKFSGRGLGMANAVGIVRAHGGAIHVRSVPGEGTVVTVVLPAAEPAVEG